MHTIPRLTGFLRMFTGPLGQSLSVCALLALGVELARGDELFDREVAPILQKHCVECHGPDEPEAKLRLSTREGLLYGSVSGRVMVPGAAKSSLLIRLLAAEAKPHMPPEGQLSPAEIATLSRWIDRQSLDALPPRESAVSADHWAYRPLTRSVVPTVKQPAWVRNAIDSFVLAQLESAGLAPAAAADPVTLCRRLYFDLIGLPPSPDEVQAFVDDPSEAAYRALVDKLLASPHYGERWGRHWLDLARYADSSGYHEDIDRPLAWKYRDYVIASLNADKPYAQFITEQLAGDELAPESAEAWIATGFCRCGPTNDSNMGEGSAKEKYRLDLLDDVISTTSAVFLGQTIGCARCHDHKLDPILQTEYYRLLAIFDNTQRVDVSVDEHGQPSMVVSTGEKNASTKDKPRAAKSIMALVNAPQSPRATHVLWRGDVLNRGPAVEPGIPAALAVEPFVLPTSAPSESPRLAVGRRLALANWIASPRNPLTWRVLANRIWQHHLGDGLVATPSNFGRSGAEPTHPELLDHLAHELLAADGRWKPLHRLIVTSATYRQAHATDAAQRERGLKVDPDNRLLWRAPQRRLEAEALRDAVLSVSGTLNRAVGGPGVKPRIRPDLLVASQRNKWPLVERDGPEHWRRSVYIYIKRQLPFPLLELFDQPNAAQTCERRDENVVPTQALVLMNDEFMTEQARQFADRVLREAPQSPEAQVRRAVQLALGREPGQHELGETVEFVRSQSSVYQQSGAAAPTAARRALADVCHVLLNCNEFIYVD